MRVAFCHSSFTVGNNTVDSYEHMTNINDTVKQLSWKASIIAYKGRDDPPYVLVYTDKIILNAVKVMEQFFGLVNTFLQNHRHTWKRRLGVRTYKVSSFISIKPNILVLNSL